MSIEDRIYSYIVQELNDNIEFDSDINLIQEKIINSLGFMKLIDFLERTFTFEIDVSRVDEDNFSTIKDISDFVITLAEAS